MGRLYAANRIRELRKQAGLTQEDIAAGLGGTTTKGTVAKLENRAMALSLDYLIGIARVIGVPASEIISPSQGGAREIPLLGAVAAGHWRDVVSDATETVPIPAWLQGNNLFALRVTGDSMDKIVPDGGIIAVNPDDLDLVGGRVYVVANGHHETTFKRFSASPPRLLPCSNNPEHQPIEIGREPFLTIGRAIWAMIPL